jgi:hypothetical protein
MVVPQPRGQTICFAFGFLREPCRTALNLYFFLELQIRDSHGPNLLPDDLPGLFCKLEIMVSLLDASSKPLLGDLSMQFFIAFDIVVCVRITKTKRLHPILRYEKEITKVHIRHLTALVQASEKNLCHESIFIEPTGFDEVQSRAVLVQDLHKLRPKVRSFAAKEIAERIIDDL